MRWVRSNMHFGARLALIALALQLVLTFGHVHGVAGNHSDSSPSLLLAAFAPAHGGQTQGHDGDADDLCPICMAAAAMGNAVASTPPVLPVAIAYATVDHAIAPFAAIAQPQRAAFQSRGPPIS